MPICCYYFWEIERTSSFGISGKRSTGIERRLVPFFWPSCSVEARLQHPSIHPFGKLAIRAMPSIILCPSSVRSNGGTMEERSDGPRTRGSGMSALLRVWSTVFSSGEGQCIHVSAAVLFGSSCQGQASRSVVYLAGR